MGCVSSKSKNKENKRLTKISKKSQLKKQVSKQIPPVETIDHQQPKSSSVNKSNPQHVDSGALPGTSEIKK